jgi:hypothetical protein
MFVIGDCPVNTALIIEFIMANTFYYIALPKILFFLNEENLNLSIIITSCILIS